MHFVLTYDLTAEGQRRTEIENEITNILSPYQFVHRLSTFFIIHVDTLNQWETIRVALTELARRIPEQFFFIMSPAMSVGRYNGFLPQEQWNDINAITALN